MAQEVRQSLSPKAVLKGRLIYRLNFAAILNTPESEFAKLISEIEQDPFVQRLLRPEDPSFKVLTKKRFPNTRLASGFYELNEDRVRSASDSGDVETLLQRHRGMTDLIRRIGRENFEKHFLYRQGSETMDEAARACGLTPQEGKDLASLLLELSVQSEFYHPSSLPPEGEIHYTLVARIEIDKDRPVIFYFSPHMASGRYMVNRDRLPELKKTLNKEEKKKLREVLTKIDWINLRQDTLQKSINAWVLRQHSYLRTGEPAAQAPYTQKDLSRDLKLAASTVSRALYGKSVILPWGDERPLKDLFLNKRETAIRRIGELLSNLPKLEQERMSDEGLARLLFSKYRLKASRRSVNLYRRAAAKSA
ncbi:MAG: hypothetical protein A3A86_01125 [Elusimicrobia bacterium RIFCSPLOWO2_01_FULL_60_11]|nr:MAG: hypothetical protein A3A86_01125 [Elusimicrobia bacterium RIFCSPLOWO2_01_FULL_60_11]